MIQCFRKFCLFFVVFVCVNHQSIWSYVLPNSYRNSYRNSYSTITDRKISSKSSEKYAVPDWLVGDGSEQNLRPKVTVKFVNTVSGKDVVAEVDQGSNLLAVGDSVGVELPRACRTGLCGSCTCELKDPSAIKTETNPRDGYATIRACSVKCFVPEGMTEMVVDVGRMKKRKSRTVGDSTTLSVETEDEVVMDPMARFSGDWEREFKPLWESTEGQAAPGGRFRKKVICKRCAGKGRLVCYACNGKGKVMMDRNKTVQCATCVGMQTIGCGYCRATGFLDKSSTK